MSLRRIREAIFIPTAKERIVYRYENIADKTIQAALDHYCVVCDRGFGGRGSQKNHVRLKHPERYEKPTTT